MYLEDGSKDGNWAIKFGLFWCWLLSFALHTKTVTVRKCCWCWGFWLKDGAENLPEMCTCTQHAGIFLGLDPLCCTCRWRVLCLPMMFSGLLCHTSQPRACWQTEVVFKTGTHILLVLRCSIPATEESHHFRRFQTISGGFSLPVHWHGPAVADWPCKEDQHADICISLCPLWSYPHVESMLPTSILIWQETWAQKIPQST